MNHKNIFVALLLLMPAVCFAAPKPTPKPTYKLCINARTGGIVAKAKCIGTETTLDLSAIQAISTNTAPGVFDVNKCSPLSAQSTAPVITEATVNCPDGQFILTHGARILDSVEVDINEIVLLFTSELTVPKGVRYSARINEIKELNLPFTLRVEAVCCRR